MIINLCRFNRTVRRTGFKISHDPWGGKPQESEEMMAKFADRHGFSP